MDTDTDEEGPYSPVSEISKTYESVANGLMRDSELINETSSIPRYQLPIRESLDARNENMKTRKFTLGIVLY